MIDKRLNNAFGAKDDLHSFPIRRHDDDRCMYCGAVLIEWSLSRPMGGVPVFCPLSPITRLITVPTEVAETVYGRKIVLRETE